MNWSLTEWKEPISVAHDLIVSVAALVGGLWVVFRLWRERTDQAALTIDVAVQVDRWAGEREFAVGINAQLRNVGKTRIKAKSPRRGVLAYEDKDERLAHGCSLQLKRVVSSTQTSLPLVDWFGSGSLEPISSLSEINLLSAYENPKRDYRVEFWMEPGETYCVGASVVLAPGVYFAKVTFVAKGGDENFWTRIVQFVVVSPRQSATPA